MFINTANEYQNFKRSIFHGHEKFYESITVALSVTITMIPFDPIKEKACSRN